MLIQIAPFQHLQHPSVDAMEPTAHTFPYKLMEKMPECLQDKDYIDLMQALYEFADTPCLQGTLLDIRRRLHRAQYFSWRIASPTLCRYRHSSSLGHRATQRVMLVAFCINIVIFSILYVVYRTPIKDGLGSRPGGRYRASGALEGIILVPFCLSFWNFHIAVFPAVSQARIRTDTL
jgi:hypothetical protein